MSEVQNLYLKSSNAKNGQQIFSMQRKFWQKFLKIYDLRCKSIKTLNKKLRIDYFDVVGTVKPSLYQPQFLE